MQNRGQDGIFSFNDITIKYLEFAEIFWQHCYWKFVQSDFLQRDAGKLTFAAGNPSVHSKSEQNPSAFL